MQKTQNSSEIASAGLSIQFLRNSGTNKLLHLEHQLHFLEVGSLCLPFCPPGMAQGFTVHLHPTHQKVAKKEFNRSHPNLMSCVSFRARKGYFKHRPNRSAMNKGKRSASGTHHASTKPKGSRTTALTVSQELLACVVGRFLG